MVTNGLGKENSVLALEKYAKHLLYFIGLYKKEQVYNFFSKISEKLRNFSGNRPWGFAVFFSSWKFQQLKSFIFIINLHEKYI